MSTTEPAAPNLEPPATMAEALAANDELREWIVKQKPNADELADWFLRHQALLVNQFPPES